MKKEKNATSEKTALQKTPLPYYGGKLHLLKYILPLIPEHKIYTESFFGGGAVFFAKQPVKTEVINDSNDNVVNFYRVLRERFDELKKMILATLHSRSDYKRALVIYNRAEKFSSKPVLRAWALWVCVIQGYSHSIGSWCYDFVGKKPKLLANKKITLTQEYVHRLEQTQIENNEALKVIRNYDKSETFHYIDPPYFNADMGHYGGYTKEDFENLLKVLSKIKGKFLLSCYPSDVLDEYIRKNRWNKRAIPLRVCASHKTPHKRKIEMLVWNYEYPEHSLNGVKVSLHPFFMVNRILETFYHNNRTVKK